MPFNWDAFSSPEKKSSWDAFSSPEESVKQHPVNTGGRGLLAPLDAVMAAGGQARDWALGKVGLPGAEQIGEEHPEAVAAINPLMWPSAAVGVAAKLYGGSYLPGAEHVKAAGEAYSGANLAAATDPTTSALALLGGSMPKAAEIAIQALMAKGLVENAAALKDEVLANGWTPKATKIATAGGVNLAGIIGAHAMGKKAPAREVSEAGFAEAAAPPRPFEIPPEALPDVWYGEVPPEAAPSPAAPPETPPPTAPPPPPPPLSLGQEGPSVQGPESAEAFAERHPEMRSVRSVVEAFFNTAMDNLQAAVPESLRPPEAKTQAILDQYESTLAGLKTGVKTFIGETFPKWQGAEKTEAFVSPLKQAHLIADAVARGEIPPEAGPIQWLMGLARTATHEAVHSFAGTQDSVAGPSGRITRHPQGRELMDLLTKKVGDDPNVLKAHRAIVEAFRDPASPNGQWLEEQYNRAIEMESERISHGASIGMEAEAPGFTAKEEPFELPGAPGAPPPPGLPPPPSGPGEQLPWEQLPLPGMEKAFPPPRAAWKGTVEDVLSTPRAFIAGFDLSGLRQAAPLIARYPRKVGKAVSLAIREAMANPMNASELEHQFLTDPATLKAQKLGLELTSAQVRPEEVFYGNRLIATAFRKVGLGKIDPWTRTERGYTLMLNKMRVDVVNYKAELMERLGFTPENEPAVYKQMIDLVNNLSGRGELPQGEGAIATAFRGGQKLLNGVLFSPRMMASRVRMGKFALDLANPVKWAKMSPAERHVAVQGALDLGAYISLVTAVTSLTANAIGGKVEEDPNSSDFRKVRKGNVRLDFSGGIQPFIRSAAQLISGKRKTKYGQTTAASRLDVIGQFARSRLAPIPATVFDLLKGRKVTGERVTPAGEAAELIPMTLNDIIDIGREDPGLAIAMAPFAILGIVSSSVHEAPLGGALGAASEEEFYRLHVSPPRGVESVRGPRGARMKLSQDEYEEMEKEGQDRMREPLEKLLADPSFRNLGPTAQQKILDLLTKRLRARESLIVGRKMLKRHPELGAPPSLPPPEEDEAPEEAVLTAPPEF